MLYLIGGPGRAGKTTLAMRLTGRHGIPHFSLDYLMMGLHHGAPALEVDPNLPEDVVAPRMWPVVSGLLGAMLENGEEYCVEGFALTPDRVAEVDERLRGGVRVCFLGYCDADPERKLRQERQHQTTNAWPSDLSHEAAIAQLEQFRQVSISLRADCRRTGYTFFDTSEEFEAALDRAEQYLLAKL
jgi:hypothetical protein